MGGNHKEFPIFNGKNYDSWSIRMRAYLMSQDLWDLVVNGYDEDDSSKGKSSKDVEAKEMRTKDGKALSTILEAIPESVVPCLADAMTSKEAWIILNRKYCGDRKKRKRSQTQGGLAPLVSVKKVKFTVEKDANGGASKENITGNSVSQLYDNQTTGKEVESSLISGGSEFHVFLSFRGEDTRKGFTSHLYDDLMGHGISTFIDSKKLEKGERIDKLFEYIEKSKIIVIIFSKRYAQSRWCLKEVTRSVECKKEIIPVFFGVEPSDVRKQCGPFKSAFRKHESNEEQNKEDVRKWRKALEKVGSLSGFTLKDGEEAKLRREIVKLVSTKVSGKTLVVTKHPIGLETRVEDVKKILEDGSKCGHQVHVIGIHGMGGLGKTTIAKAVHNDLSKGFDGTTCFLSNIRERSGHPNGLVNLQKQLISDIFKEKDIRLSDVSCGQSLIKERANRKRVLLVLDDVDSVEQLDALAGGRDWFGSGSVIIITTRDKGVLLTHKVKEKEIYKPQELNKAQSTELFILHAFDGVQPQGEYAQLANQVVEAAGGLPLTIKVLGSLLSSIKDVREWKDILEKVKKFPPDEVQQKLKISYDSLGCYQKKIFLDISYFFIGQGRRNATYMWEGCGWHPEEAIGVLVRRSLITINEKSGEFEMHDQIRDMGREIVAGESSPVPEKHSRLREPESLNLLRQGIVGTKDVEAIQVICKRDNPTSVDVGYFAAMSQLRMLRLDKVTLEGKYETFPRNIRWLDWSPQDLDSLPSSLHLENIAVLDLSWSSIVRVWDLRKVFHQLKVLDLGHCTSLVICPDFTSMSHLEILNFYGCVKMSELHPSIGLLKSLAELCLASCESLKELPETVYELSSLQKLDLSGCEITAFPPPSSDSKSSEQHVLGKLEVLLLNDCRNLIICPDFVKMPNLGRLSFSWCKEMNELHPSIWCLKSLIYLNLRGCSSLKGLPQEAGQLTSLKQLNQEECSQVTALPSPIEDSMSSKQSKDSKLSEQHVLEKLEVLLLDDCYDLIMCPDFTKMRNLETLSFHNCGKLSELGPSIGCLESLTHLDLGYCESLKGLPREAWQLTSLEVLNLRGCSQITALPSLIGDSMSSNQPLLEKLKFLNLGYCSSLISCPNFTSMPHLERLWLGYCAEISELDPSICHLKSLTQLDLNSCGSLKELPPEIGQLTSLKKLDLSGCSQISCLPESIGHLKQLNQLLLQGCSSLQEVPKSIVSLDQLETLWISYSDLLKSLPRLPPSLIALYASNCSQLERMGDISNVEGLQKLDLSFGERLVDVPGIEQLNFLEFLNLGECRSLCDSIVRRIKDLAKLKKLEFGNCESLTKSPHFTSNMTHLEHLYFGGCVQMVEVDPSIHHLKALTSLNLWNCKSLKELPEEVSQLTSLEHLNLSGCCQITALPEFIGHLKQLQHLDLENCSSLREVPESICLLLDLEELNASLCKNLAALPNSLGKLKRLSYLDLSWTAIEQLPDTIIQLEMLDHLSVAHCNALKFLPQLPPSLTHLNAEFCVELERIGDVSFLKGLEILNLTCCRKLPDIPGIEQLTGLQFLLLGGCISLQYSFLERLQSIFLNIKDPEDFAIPGRLITGRSPYPQSLSFPVPKHFKNFHGSMLYLYVDESCLSGIRLALHESSLNSGRSERPESMGSSDEDRNQLDSIASGIADESSIGTDEVGRSVVRLSLSINDVQFPFSASFDDWNDEGRTIPIATFRCEELMQKVAEADVDCIWMMNMHVSIDGCTLLHGHFFSPDAYEQEDINSVLGELGHNIVVVLFD
ncbi:unnamed protein product [Victoria cruziana]